MGQALFSRPARMRRMQGFAGHEPTWRPATAPRPAARTRAENFGGAGPTTDYFAAGTGTSGGAFGAGGTVGDAGTALLTGASKRKSIAVFWSLHSRLPLTVKG